jgi:hypothetical protein
MGLVCCGASNEDLGTLFAIAAFALIGTRPEHASAFAG